MRGAGAAGPSPALPAGIKRFPSVQDRLPCAVLQHSLHMHLPEPQLLHLLLTWELHVRDWQPLLQDV